MLAVELQSSNSNHLLNLSIISSEILGQIHPTLPRPALPSLEARFETTKRCLPQTSPSQNSSPQHRKKTQHGSRTRCAIPQRVNHSAHVLRCHDVLFCGRWHIYSLDQFDELKQNKPQPTIEHWVAVPRNTHQWLSLSVETSMYSVATVRSALCVITCVVFQMGRMLWVMWTVMLQISAVALLDDDGKMCVRSWKSVWTNRLNVYWTVNSIECCSIGSRISSCILSISAFQSMLPVASVHVCHETRCPSFVANSVSLSFVKGWSTVFCCTDSLNVQFFSWHSFLYSQFTRRDVSTFVEASSQWYSSGSREVNTVSGHSDFDWHTPLCQQWLQSQSGCTFWTSEYNNIPKTNVLLVLLVFLTDLNFRDPVLTLVFEALTWKFAALHKALLLVVIERWRSKVAMTVFAATSNSSMCFAVQSDHA